MSTETIVELEQLKIDLLSQVNALSITINILRSKLPNIQVEATIAKLENSVSDLLKPNMEQVISNVQNDYSALVLRTISDIGHFIKKSEIANYNQFIDVPDHSIRSALSYLKKKGVIVSYTASPNNSDTFWGLKDWKNGDVIKTPFMYDETKLIYKK